jgi:predicted transcriptional regulator
MSNAIKPTDSELEILEKNKEAGYTTTLKLMQIMHDKKLLKRDASSKSHVYTANVSQEKTQGQYVKRIIDNVFNGSASQLVMQALGNHKTNKKELEEIKKYLEEMENRNK